MRDLEPPALRSPPPAVFFGADGLRPGWGILIFLLLLLTLGLTVSFLNVMGERALGYTAPRPELRDTANESTAGQTTPAHLLVSEGSSLLVILLATLTLSRIERRRVKTYGLATSRCLPHFTQGLLLGLLFLSVLVATLSATGHLAIDARLLHGFAVARYGTVWAIGFGMVAFFEELLLRGYLQYTLARGLNAIVSAVSDTPHPDAWAFWSAALILSSVFGLIHGSNPGESPIGLLSAGLAGMVFSFALYRTGSLWWAIGFHTSWDWAQSFLYSVPDSGSMVQHHLFATHPLGSAVLSGGPTGPEGSIFILPTLALVPAIIALTQPGRPYPHN